MNVLALVESALANLRETSVLDAFRVVAYIEHSRLAKPNADEEPSAGVALRGAYYRTFDDGLRRVSETPGCSE